MNIWATAVITEKGLALQAKLVEGNTLKITRAVTGTGFVQPGLLPKQSGVIGPMQELAIQPVSYPEVGKCAMPVMLTNEAVDIGYTACQIGIYAQDPDEGEILYFIAQSPDAETGTVVPSKNEMAGYSAEWTFYFQYGQADEVYVTVDPTGFVSRVEMVNYIEDTFVAITNAEIDEAFDGEYDPGAGGEGGTDDHNLLYNRDMEDQHPISAITDLEEVLDEKMDGSDAMTSDEIENILSDETEEVLAEETEE